VEHEIIDELPHQEYHGLIELSVFHEQALDGAAFVVWLKQE